MLIVDYLSNSVSQMYKEITIRYVSKFYDLQYHLLLFYLVHILVLISIHYISQ